MADALASLPSPIITRDIVANAVAVLGIRVVVLVGNGLLQGHLRAQSRMVGKPSMLASVSRFSNGRSTPNLFLPTSEFLDTFTPLSLEILRYCSTVDLRSMYERKH